MILFLVIVLVWLVTVFVLWKYSKWSKTIKFILTFIISLLSLLMLLFFSFFYLIHWIDISSGTPGIQTASAPKTGTLECSSLNTQWSKCTDHRISFEYPSTWFYKKTISSSEDIQFGPVNPVTGSNQSVILYIQQWKSEEDAYKEIKNLFSLVNGKGGETTINGVHATIGLDGKSVSFGYKDQTYLFNFYDFNSPANSITKDQAKIGFDHITSTFKVEN